MEKRFNQPLGSYLPALVSTFVIVMAAQRISAQANSSSFSPSTSNQITDLKWNQTVNHNSSTLALSDYKGKLIVLDFWATTCGSCIKSFPKLDSLQRQYNDQIKIILVDYWDTDLNRVKKVFASTNQRVGKRFIIPTVVADTAAKQAFPHTTIPHLVWLNKDGQIVAITDSEELTASNIDKVLAGGPVNLTEKRDLNLDYSRPLFGIDGQIKTEPIFNSTLTGFISGVSNGRGVNETTDGKIDRIFVINESILNIFAFAYPDLGQYRPHRFILDVKDSVHYTSDHPDRIWRSQHAYTYELTLPAATKQEALSLMQQDLQKYFKISVQRQVRLAKCWVISQVPGQQLQSGYAANSTPTDNLRSNGKVAKFIHNKPIVTLVNHLNQLYDIPVIDETNHKAPLNLELPADLTDTAALQAALQKHGLQIQRLEKNIEYMILSDKP